MAASRKPLARRMDDVRAALATDRRVAALETELAAVRQREQMYRAGWRDAVARRDRYYLAMITYRRAARRRYLVMLRLAEWSRRGHDQAQVVGALARRYRDRWNEALADGERFRQEAHYLRARADRWLDRCKNRTAERDAARADAQDARNALGKVVRERDQARADLRMATEHIRHSTQHMRATNDRMRDFIATWKARHRD